MNAKTPPSSSLSNPEVRRAELERQVVALWDAAMEAELQHRAGLLRERRITLSELAALGDVKSEESTLDQLASRREARRSAADDSAQSSRRGQSRRRGRGDRTS